MIKARAGNLILFGLEGGNIDRLKEGQPMLIDLAKLGLPDIKIAIVYGDTQADVLAEIERQTGLKPPPIAPVNATPH